MRSTRFFVSASITILVMALGTVAAAGPPVRDNGPALVSSRGGARLPAPATDDDFISPSAEQVELGRLLFYDKILSGNRNISCASCHHSLTDTGDGLSLPVGEGGRGLGVARDTGHGVDAIHARVPRNAPPVFNLGAREFDTMFHDGRVRVDANEPGGFLSPAGADLPDGLENVLAAQAMFPVTSGEEMAGQSDENEISIAAAAGKLAGDDGVWELLAVRLRDIDGYVDRFMDVYDLASPDQITYVHAANAIAAFEADVWRADDSPFDRYLRREPQAMSLAARRGMRLFYGRAGCASCHAGTFQTDHDFHAIAMPQIGPGKGDGFDGHEDFGRERVTGERDDRCAFRTPTLRNVALTGPWGHDGAYDTLEAVVRHHLDPLEGIESYEMDQAVLPPRDDLDAVDFMVQTDPARRNAIAAECDLEPVRLRERDVAALIDFLHALTDPASLDLRRDVPMSVPSGLPIAD